MARSPKSVKLEGYGCAKLAALTQISAQASAQVLCSAGLFGRRLRLRHDWNMWWGGGGMWFGPLWMIAWLAVLVAVIVAVVRWLGEKGVGGYRPARGVLAQPGSALSQQISMSDRLTNGAAPSLIIVQNMPPTAGLALPRHGV
jgi:hypothetical protein